MMTPRESIINNQWAEARSLQTSHNASGHLSTTKHEEAPKINSALVEKSY